MDTINKTDYYQPMLRKIPLKKIFSTAFFLATLISFSFVTFLEWRHKYNNISWYLLLIASFIHSTGPITILVLLSILLRKKHLNIPLTITLVILQVLNLSSQMYFIDRRFSFDIYLFLYNTNVALKTVSLVYPKLLIKLLGVLIISIVYFFSLLETGSFFTEQLCKFKRPMKIARIFLLLYLPFIVFLTTKTEIYNVLLSLTNRGNEVRKVYNKYYKYQLEEQSSIEVTTTQLSSPQNIMIIQLESLNSDLVNDRITPNLMKIMDRGIYMKNMVANSVNSARSFEGGLCGLIPSLSADVSRLNVDMTKLPCLPRILKKHGYTTIFFLSNDTLGDVEPFISKVGFDEIHFNDIMQPEDKKLRWGYSDSIFLKRVGEYLSERNDRNLFAFIDLTTNHFPFYDLSKNETPEYNNMVPNPSAKFVKEKLENTTYLQDMFLGEFYKKYYEPYFSENTDLILFSDHSWPLGIHPNNYFNENYAYQENFLIPFVFIPSNQTAKKYAVGTVSDSVYGQYNIPSTILDLLDIEDYFHKTSFLGVLTGKSPIQNERCTVSTQPYSGGYISLVQYPIKHLYSLKENKVYIFNLEEDPNELNPNIEEISKENKDIMESCLRNTLNHFVK